ncbi:MAG: hypothetical protein QXV46_03830 [Candidatus Bathyarchaeia archaeon]
MSEGTIPLISIPNNIVDAIRLPAGEILKSVREEIWKKMVKGLNKT